MVDDPLEPMYVGSYFFTQIPTLGQVLGKWLPPDLDDWVLWFRFWQFVVCDVQSQCWLWQRPLNGDHYGTIRVRTNQPIHRVVYEWLVGPIPPDLVIDHLCRVRHCVNPGHLEAVTNEENIRRGHGAPANHRRKTHCPQGHPYDEANTILIPGGLGRRCRTCRDDYFTEHREHILGRRAELYRERVGRPVLPKSGDRTHCKYGHEYTPENTFVTSQGFRQCRECNRKRDQERYRNDPKRNASVKQRAKESRIKRTNNTENK